MLNCIRCSIRHREYEAPGTLASRQGGDLGKEMPFGGLPRTWRRWPNRPFTASQTNYSQCPWSQVGEGRQLVFVVQSLSCVIPFETPWTAAHQAPLSFTISWSLLKLMSIESVMPSNHLIFCHLLQSFLASGSFPMSWLFASGSQSFGGFSFSISISPCDK